MIWSDFVLVWGLPPLFFLLLFILSTFILYLFIKSPRSFLFKEDIQNKVDKKKRLPSGANVRLSYGYLLALLLLDNGIQATLFYRISRYLLEHRWRSLAVVVHAFAKFLTHIDISPHAVIGPGLTFYHGLGVVIGKNTKLGSRVTVCQNVTTGGGRPQIGDDVILWAGAKIIGSHQIGDRAEVGANAVVISDVPSDCVAVGIPAQRFLPKAKNEQIDFDIVID
ncbi:MAG: hypothetical protein H6658_05145 [Ardenticatenaceae bacterium]|nr:hypothetical protein [Ardenticatenaceae bacterium]